MVVFDGYETPSGMKFGQKSTSDQIGRFCLNEVEIIPGASKGIRINLNRPKN